MPMALRPETTATRADTALIERAMSSASPMTRDDLMPGAGSSSYSVTTGPGRALMISPRTPKSESTLSSEAAAASMTSFGICERSDAFCAASRLSEGRSKPEPDLRAGARGAARFLGAGASSSSSSPSAS